MSQPQGAISLMKLASGGPTGSTLNKTKTQKGGTEFTRSDAAINDVYKTRLNDMQTQAAFGVNILDVMEAKSGGRDNMTKDLLYTIQDQYVTASAAAVDTIWGAIVGMFAGTLILALLGENTDNKRFAGLFLHFNMQTFSLALFCAGLLVVLTDFYTVVKTKKCTKKMLDAKKDANYIKDHFDMGVREGQAKVDPDYQGLRCQEDSDCTKGGFVYPGACAHPEKSLPQRIFRTVIAKVVLLAGIVVFAVTWATTDESERVPPVQLYQAAIYGMGAGVLASIFFS